jgi:hypothetical protein
MAPSTHHFLVFIVFNVLCWQSLMLALVMKPVAERVGSKRLLMSGWTVRNIVIAPVELYDLEHDPNEFHNLANDPAHAAVRAELDARLWNFLLDHNDFVVNEPVRDDWQRQTRRMHEAHCAAHGRVPPVIDGWPAHE